MCFHQFLSLDYIQNIFFVLENTAKILTEISEMCCYYNV